MDLTTGLGVVALALTAGIFLLVVRDAVLVAWQIAPSWFRLFLIAALVIAVAVAANDLLVVP